MTTMVELKKAIAILLLAVFLSSILSARQGEIFVAASPTTIHVFPAAHPTVQEAINSANPGDTILVHEGTYYEDIVINKSVLLVGQDRDLTVIYGNQSQYVIYVMAGGASVKGFTVRKNPLNPYGSGIIVGSVGNVILHNKIEDSYYGLIISSSDNNDVSDNIISNNTNGLTLSFSNNNAFSDNVVSNNIMGVWLYFSNNNVFSTNSVRDNAAGITFYSSGGNNAIYHNNFNNTVQFLSDLTNSTNVWSQNGEGNYWSDYAGQDSNNDGIGDSPYTTDTENRDNYPLMGPFSNLKVVLKGQPYFVNLVCNSTVSGLSFEIGEETGNRIVIFNVAGGEGTIGFSRIMIPLNLMGPPFIVISSEGEITPTLLGVSNETNVYLYFTWTHSNQSISIVSSQTLHLYSELLDKYAKLQDDLYNLNATYNSFMENYHVLLDGFGELQSRYLALNASYYEHLSDYSRNVENIQNLLYIFAATTAIFMVTTIYLSKRAHTGRGSESSKMKNNTY
jgi:parallel beta-helix repeat protein